MTDQPRWQQARELVERALQVPEAERAGWLAEQCGDDDELLELCQDLLARHGSGETLFLESPLREIAAPTLEGATLSDLEIGEQIGRGGMATVHRARDLRLDREVAVKFLRGGALAEQSDIDRFHRESRSASRLRHPGIVPVFAEGQDGDLHWFTMELVPGRDLGAELEALRAKPEPHVDARFPGPGAPGHAATIARLVADVAEALHHAHQHGVVHRDIKPANLLLHDDLRIRITDFGIARTEGLGQLTKTGHAAGTSYYMSPEQIAADGIDHRTDVYSLGVVLYELATLKRPFEGKTAELVRERIRSVEPQPPRKLNPALPRDIESICLRAIHKDPRQRYPDAQAFARDLRAFLNHEAIVARPPSPLRHVAYWIRRNRAALLATAATLLVTLLVAGWWRDAAATDRERAAAREALEFAAEAEPGIAGLVKRVRAWASLAKVDLSRLDPALRDRVVESRRELAPAGPAELDDAEQSVREAVSLLINDPLATATNQQTARFLDLFALIARAPTVHVSKLSNLFDARLRAAEPPADLPPELRVALHRFSASAARPDPGPILEVPARELPVMVPPGLYRITISGGAAGRQDRQRLMQVAADTPLDLADLRAPDTSNMVAVPAMLLNLESFPDTANMVEAQELRVDSFLIDDAEVTVAEFRSFCDATGWNATSRFRRLAERPEDLDRPAVYVTFEGARAYAEWRGKRLPTLPEFWAALVHTDSTQTFPPEQGFEGALFQPWWDQPDPPSGSTELAVASWRQSTLPVRADAPRPGTARNAAGIWHLLGNVAEWTGSTYFRKSRDGSKQLMTNARLIAGGSWDYMSEQPRHEPIWMLPTGPEGLNRDVGFRCVVPLDD